MEARIVLNSLKRKNECKTSITRNMYIKLRNANPFSETAVF